MIHLWIDLLNQCVLFNVLAAAGAFLRNETSLYFIILLLFIATAGVFFLLYIRISVVKHSCTRLFFFVVTAAAGAS